MTGDAVCKVGVVNDNAFPAIEGVADGAHPGVMVGWNRLGVTGEAVTGRCMHKGDILPTGCPVALPALPGEMIGGPDGYVARCAMVDTVAVCAQRSNMVAGSAKRQVRVTFRLVDVHHRATPGIGQVATGAQTQVMMVGRLLSMTHPAIGWLGMVDRVILPTGGYMAV